MAEYNLKVYRNGRYETVPINIPPGCMPPEATVSPIVFLWEKTFTDFNITHPIITNDGIGNIPIE